MGTHLEILPRLAQGGASHASAVVPRHVEATAGGAEGFMSMAGRPRASGWPRTPQGMGRALHRIAPALEMARYTVVFERDPSTQEARPLGDARGARRESAFGRFGRFGH